MKITKNLTNELDIIGDFCCCCFPLRRRFDDDDDEEAIVEWDSIPALKFIHMKLNFCLILIIYLVQWNV